MPPYSHPINIQDIYDYYKLINGQYLAKENDKIIVWYNYDGLQSMFDTVVGLEKEYNSEMIDFNGVTEGFTNYITSLEHWKECKVVEGKVDNITYKTKIKQMELKTGISPYYRFNYVNIHNVILAEPKIHPIYGEYVGWSTSVITL
jgi:hypothetical protein